jgi:lipopolysaccharide transport system ATP-binding protein
VATVHGRISSLLEVGTGFHPELSGRENVYLNGTILGMRKKEIDQKFDEIVAFSEIEKFLDTPVKRYSSGMRVRLAFSVAAHLEPEILIIDEVLAVGDTAFQKKCLGKMEGVAKEGRTVLFVSHNMSLVAELCTRCLLMQNGKVLETGDTKDIVSKYISTDRSSGSIDLKDWSIERQGNGPMRVSYLHTEDEHGRIRAHFQHGEPMIFKIGVSGRKSSQCIIGLSVRNTFGQLILHFSNLDDDAELTLPTDESFVTMRLENNVLNDGQYYVTVFLGDGFNIKNDYVYNCLFFEIDSTVQGRVVCNSPVRLPAHWEIS